MRSTERTAAHCLDIRHTGSGHERESVLSAKTNEADRSPIKGTRPLFFFPTVSFLLRSILIETSPRPPNFLRTEGGKAIAREGGKNEVSVPSSNEREKKNDTETPEASRFRFPSDRGLVASSTRSSTLLLFLPFLRRRGRPLLLHHAQTPRALTCLLLCVNYLRPPFLLPSLPLIPSSLCPSGSSVLPAYPPAHLVSCPDKIGFLTLSLPDFPG